LIAELEKAPIKGAVLHWWRGSPAATDKALALGAYFSFNPAGIGNTKLLSQVPLDRILVETDHPDGDRRSPAPRHPGRVEQVETKLANLAPHKSRRCQGCDLAKSKGPTR
jgi:TatD DNase family protein